MVNRYNFYNFEAPFKEYLTAGNRSSVSIKNYLSDYRHFVGWLSIQPNISNDENESEASYIKQSLTKHHIEQYRDYLIKNKIPTKTINRRLSTLRKFCSFCISQGWIDENPGKKIINTHISFQSLSPEDKDKLDEYTIDLNKENLNNHIVANNLNIVQEFLSIINS